MDWSLHGFLVGLFHSLSGGLSLCGSLLMCAGLLSWRRCLLQSWHGGCLRSSLGHSHILNDMWLSIFLSRRSDWHGSWDRFRIRRTLREGREGLRGQRVGGDHLFSLCGLHRRRNLQRNCILIDGEGSILGNWRAFWSANFSGKL